MATDTKPVDVVVLETEELLALALRELPVGSFHSVGGDLRSEEAAARAAKELVDMFASVGLEFAPVSESKAESATVPEATSGPDSKRSQ